VPLVCEVLSRTSLPPSSLELEIVESALLSKDASASLRALSDLGVRIALDDFGTGYSSITRLQDLAVDTLKLDGSFVRHLGRSNRDAEIIKGVIGFAHRLELEVVAECVEQESQLHILGEAGCDLVQGFLLGMPRPDLPPADAR
jgi:EAL domain-containing protein (putative c-di-GMP-specific phosphodiesterase class I)